MNDGTEDEEPAELAKGDKTARNGTVGSIDGILFGILELVGNAELEEKNEAGHESDQEHRNVRERSF